MTTAAMDSDVIIFITGEAAERTGIKEIAGFVTEMNAGCSIEGPFIEFKIIGTPTENGKTIPAVQCNVSLQQIAPLPTFPKNKVIKTVGECLKIAHKILDEEEE
jgi:hypothetical protein